MPHPRRINNMAGTSTPYPPGRSDRAGTYHQSRQHVWNAATPGGTAGHVLPAQDQPWILTTQPWILTSESPDAKAGGYRLTRCARPRITATDRDRRWPVEVVAGL